MWLGCAVRGVAKLLGSLRPRVSAQRRLKRRTADLPLQRLGVVAAYVLPVAHAAWSLGDKGGLQTKTVAASTTKMTTPTLDDILAKADALYAQHKTAELYEFLKSHEALATAEVTWRLARAACDQAKSLPASDPQRKALMYEAHDSAKKALQQDDRNFACHKWFAITIQYIGEYEGTKAKISNAYAIKEHFEKAIELNPKDATSMHCIGQWCFTFAELPWYQQKIAAVLFATPPKSTYEEALKYFEMAEKTDPNFYSLNLLMLGKTYARLGNKKLAYLYLTKARDYPLHTPDDQAAHDEATSLLKGMTAPTD